MLIDAAADLIVFGGLCNCNDCDGFIAFKKKREFVYKVNRGEVRNRIFSINIKINFKFKIIVFIYKDALV